MKQWLSRGFEISTDKRIKKIICEGNDWQIYTTNQDSFVLVATTTLYDEWVASYSLPENLFFSIECYPQYKFFYSTGNYLISSLEKGPFSEDVGQIEAFSIAFNTATKLFPETMLHDHCT